MSKRNVRFEKVYFLNLRPLLPNKIAGTWRQWLTEGLGTLALLLVWLTLFFLVGG